MTFSSIKIQGKTAETAMKILEDAFESFLGALKKESVIEHYVGSIARNISRMQKCNV